MTLAEARSGAGGLGQKSTAASADLGIRLCLALVALLLLFRVLLAATADLSEDEAYYWLWSTHLAAGYYDHPPMIAYWIRAGTAVFGQTGFGVRFAAVLSSVAGSYVLYRASLSLFGDRNAALLAVLWLNATLFCNAAAIIATPDTPLAFFATVALFASAKLTETGRGAWWYALGAALGLAFMSKYTAVLLLPGIFLWMIALPSGRRWFLRPEPYLGAVIAAAIVAPVFYWNFTHDWASFAKQAQHGMGDQPGNAFASIAGLVGAQAGLATPIIFAFCVWGSFFALLRGWKRRDSRWLLPGALTAPVFLFFLSIRPAIKSSLTGPALSIRSPFWRPYIAFWHFPESGGCRHGFPAASVWPRGSALRLRRLRFCSWGPAFCLSRRRRIQPPG